MGLANPFFMGMGHESPVYTTVLIKHMHRLFQLHVTELGKTGKEESKEVVITGY